MQRSKMLFNPGDFLDSGHLISVEAGTVLMRQGAIGQSAFLLVQGKLVVSKEDEFGESKVIAELSPIDLVGEIALFDEMPRTATVIVSEDASVIELKKAHLKAIIRKSPEIAEVVIKLLCQKLRR